MAADADKPTRGLQILTLITPADERLEYHVLTDGPNAVAFAEGAREIIRGKDAKYAAGNASGIIRLAYAKDIERLGGLGLDLRGAVTMAEVERRVGEDFLPPSERNEYAGYGDERLRVEIERCRVGSHKEWAHHRDDSLRAAARMQEELDLRGRERQPAPEEEAEAAPGMGM